MSLRWLEPRGTDPLEPTWGDLLLAAVIVSSVIVFLWMRG